MNDDAIVYADAIARELVQRNTDPNELAKIATFLRLHLDEMLFFRLLDTIVSDANSRYLLRTGRTVEYYRNIREVCLRHLKAYRSAKAKQAQDMAEILGWAVRLMRYYGAVGIPQSAQTSVSTVAASVEVDQQRRTGYQRGASGKTGGSAPRRTAQGPSFTLGEQEKDQVRPNKKTSGSRTFKRGDRIQVEVAAKNGNRYTLRAVETGQEDIIHEGLYLPWEPGQRLRVTVVSVDAHGRIKQVRP